MASQWLSLPTIPSDKQIPEGYVHNGLIYVVGHASSDTSYVPSVEVFNPATNAWLPGPYAYAELDGGWEIHATGVGGAIYCFTTRTYKYDIAANTWTNLNVDGNLEFNFGAYCAVGTDIYCFAGSVVKKFNTLTNTYTTLGAWAGAREGAAARYNPADGLVYIGGGNHDTDSPSGNRSLQSYNPSTGVFTQLAYSPHGHEDVSGEILGGKFYLLGGGGYFGANDPRNNDGTLVDVYDIAAGTWSQGGFSAHSHTERLGSALLNGRIYVFGGEGTPWPASKRAAQVYVETAETGWQVGGVAL